MPGSGSWCCGRSIYIPGLFSPPLLDDADSVHAEAAREMVVRHDWTTLYIDGIRYLEKAPLLYWGMAASFKVFGVSDWAARLPLILGLLALLLVTYFSDAAPWASARASGQQSCSRCRSGRTCSRAF